MPPKQVYTAANAVGSLVDGASGPSCESILRLYMLLHSKKG